MSRLSPAPAAAAVTAGSRTDAFACPPDCRSETGDGWRVWRSDCPESAFSHRLELEQPPDDISAAFALWDELQRDTSCEHRVVTWETSLSLPFPALPPRFAPVHRLVLGREGRKGPLPVPAAPEQLQDIVSGAAACHPELGPSHVRELRWLYGGLAARGATMLASWADGRVAGSVAVQRAPEGREVRLRELWTSRSHRRRGLASALVAQALALHPDLPYLLVTEADSPAHALYAKLGFVARSRVICVSSQRFP